jgi:hypothetical protein
MLHNIDPLAIGVVQYLGNHRFPHSR